MKVAYSIRILFKDKYVYFRPVIKRHIHTNNSKPIVGGVNTTKGNFKGIQISGCFNQATGQNYDMHIAGGMNLVNKGVTGGQIAGEV